MNIKLQCTGSKQENKIIELKYEFDKSSLFIEFLTPEEGICYCLLHKDRTGKFRQKSISFDEYIKTDFLNLGENYYKIRAFKDGIFVWETESFCVVNNNMEYVYSIDETGIEVFWNRVPQSDGYMIYTKSTDGVFTSIKEVQENEVKLYGLSGTEELKIKPFRKVNGQREYIFGFIIVPLGVKSNSQNIKIFKSIKKSSIELVWNDVHNADSYKIYKLTGGQYVLQETVKDCKYSASYLPVGFSYYKIEAYSKNELLCNSQTFVCDIRNIELIAVNINYKVNLYWNRTPGAAGYRIFKKTPNGEFTAFATTQDEKFSVENIVPGEICEFKVKPFILENRERIYGDLAAKYRIATCKNFHIDLTVNEAYGNQAAVSWIFNGDVDGFTLLKNGVECLDIKDGLAHIAMVKYSDENFKIKGYKNVFGAKIYTCESDEINIKDSSSRINKKLRTNYKLSVVIPAYNAENFISRCISSVLASNMEEIQIIAVDDGSSDNTKSILTWYEKKYPYFFKKIFKENGGAADARNVGITQAKGEYITFIDSDDMIRPDAYSIMYNTLQSTGADIAIGRLYKVDNERYYIRHTLPLPAYKAINPEDYLRLLFTESYNNVAVWNKMYRTKLVQEHPIPLYSYEDVSWTPYILSWADRLCYVDKVCIEWDRKIRSFTLSNELSNRTPELKFQDRLKAVNFFYENGNQKYREVLAYLKAKRMYNQGETANYKSYFDTVTNMSDALKNNRFLLQDEEYLNKLRPYIIDID